MHLELKQLHGNHFQGSSGLQRSACRPPPSTLHPQHRSMLTAGLRLFDSTGSTPPQHRTNNKAPIFTPDILSCSVVSSCFFHEQPVLYYYSFPQPSNTANVQGNICDEPQLSQINTLSLMHPVQKTSCRNFAVSMFPWCCDGQLAEQQPPLCPDPHPQARPKTGVQQQLIFQEHLFLNLLCRVGQLIRADIPARQRTASEGLDPAAA